MTVRIVRLGMPRASGEGLRLGTVRRPPRGVRKEDYARRNFYDLWLPELAPSMALVTYAFLIPWTPARWASYSRRYRSQMNKPPAARLLALLAALSQTSEFSVGCYCADETHCHRSILRELLLQHGAVLAEAKAPVNGALVGSPRRSQTVSVRHTDR
jgi:uncharacterized protein YeaO (DUF488 family)